MKRHVYMISDGTGITAEALGNSLITQFADIPFEKSTLPYIDSEKKANDVVRKINSVFETTGIKPLIFMTIVNPVIASTLSQSNACIFDIFSTFLGPLEKELNAKSSDRVGLSHGLSNDKTYMLRIEAVDYAIAHDDGLKIKDYEKADIILVGVSRCGKTPSCLYMALQFGVLAGNYPFTDEELTHFHLPKLLKPYKDKLFGLTIDVERLQQIRSERFPGSEYASNRQCRLEVSEVENMYRQENIPFLNSTRCSVEEIATKIMAISGIKRKL